MYTTSHAPLSPLEATRNFFTNTSGGDIAWILITCFFGWLLFKIATDQIKNEKYDWVTVLRWIAIFAGNLALIIFLVWSKIVGGGGTSVMSFAVSAILSNIVVYRISKKVSDFQKIIYGTIIIILGFTFLIFFALGNQSACWATSFGFFSGVSFAMLLISIQKLIRKEDIGEEDPFESNKNFKIR